MRLWQPNLPKTALKRNKFALSLCSKRWLNQLNLKIVRLLGLPLPKPRWPVYRTLINWTAWHFNLHLKLEDSRKCFPVTIDWMKKLLSNWRESETAHSTRMEREEWTWLNLKGKIHSWPSVIKWTECLIFLSKLRRRKILRLNSSLPCVSQPPLGSLNRRLSLRRR